MPERQFGTSETSFWGSVPIEGLSTCLAYSGELSLSEFHKIKAAYGQVYWDWTDR